MPNRIIKESICESAGLSMCSFFANDLYKRLITYADDYGRFNADTQIMLARLYPRELNCVTQQDIIEALIELSGVGKLSFYTSKVRSHVYGCFPNWSEHQRVRESKAKCPDPDDTDVNDWYLQRFIPIDLKVEVIERDGFKCRICSKFITTDRDAIRLIKRGDGMYHIDHIVPVVQGGRATLENLRLTCPQCNLGRKKRFSFSEILAFSENRGDLPQVAASSGLNPIQSESESESKSNPNVCTEHGENADSAPQPVISLTLNDKSEYPITQENVDEWTKLYPAVDVMQQLRAMKGWINANPSKRKTKTGIKRFVNGWLSGEQNKGGPRPAGRDRPPDKGWKTSNPFLELLQLQEEGAADG